MTQISAQESAAARSASDYYLVVLAALLVGYAIFGKTVAYIGVPPLYIGEIVFALGIIAFLSSRCVIASFAALPNLMLMILMGWAIIRTLPYVREDGFDALRDSMIVLYGGFAFIVTALLLEKPGRVQQLIRFLRFLALVLIPVAPILAVMTNEAAHGGEGPQWSLAIAKIGTTAVHLSAAALLVLLGFKRPRLMWCILLTVGMAVAASLNRGAMLVIIFMLTCGSVLSGRLREFAVLVAVGMALLGIFYVSDVSIPTGQSTREFSAEQLIKNAASIIGEDDSQDLSGTKEWRLHWWNTIINYTVNGRYFWSGKGFGVDLGKDDGIIIHVNPNDPTSLTRSPHSAHLTLLARTGVPGLALWLFTLACWSVVVLTNMVSAWQLGDRAWASFFLLIFCYACGFLIDASFDVTLEGPMAGIWFWCVFGAGTGAGMIYRAELASIGTSPGRLSPARATATN